MATIQMNGLDEYLVKLSRLEQASKEEICGQAIHQGAGIIADAIREELKKLPTDESFGTQDHPAKGIKAVQKNGLLKSLGITGMREDNGYLNVKIGFDGYNKVKTARWPKGQPNQLVARSAESGTTWLQKSPFVRVGVRKSRKQAVQTMKKSVDQSISELMNDSSKKALFTGKKSWEK